jgi:phage shock protein C
MSAKKFYLDRRNGAMMGVCAGLARYTGIKVSYIRIAAVMVTLLGAFPWTLIAYGVAAWLAKPMPVGHYEAEDLRTLRGSTYELRESMLDRDHRMAEIDSYVATGNASLAREIEKLR